MTDKRELELEREQKASYNRVKELTQLVMKREKQLQELTSAYDSVLEKAARRELELAIEMSDKLWELEQAHAKELQKAQARALAFALSPAPDD